MGPVGSAAVAERMAALNRRRPPGHSGIGTTLSANALAITAMDVMLGEVITPAQVAGGLVILSGLALVSGVERMLTKKAGPAAQP